MPSNDQPNKSGAYRFSGTVLDSKEKTSVQDLRVELWDARADKRLDTALTDPKGDFEINLSAEVYADQCAPKRPKLEFRVFHEEDEIARPIAVANRALQENPIRLFIPVDLEKVVRGIFWKHLDGPRLLPTTTDAKPHGFEVKIIDNPLGKHTLSGLGFAVEISGKGELDQDWILIIPFRDDQVTGIDTRTIRLFVPDKKLGLQALWGSSVNPEAKFLWANVRSPGIYVPIGKPRDRLVLAAIESVARARKRQGPLGKRENQALLERTFGALAKVPPEQLQQLRFELTNFELQTRAAPPDPGDLKLGGDGVVEAFALPGGEEPEAFYERAQGLEVPRGGLPEEQLFFPPDPLELQDFPWEILPGTAEEYPLPEPAPDTPLPFPWPPEPIPLPRRPEWRARFERPELNIFELIPNLGLHFCFGRNWYMYHRDSRLSGQAKCSSIRSTNIADLQPTSATPITLDGPVLSIPSIVNGKVYVGTVTSNLSNRSGTMYKFDLATGNKEAEFPLPTHHATRPGENPLLGARQGGRTGVASSPAVVGGKVYVSTLTGFVYCLDANSLACLWYTDLRKRHQSKNQPVDHGSIAANGWSSPLVVNGRIYVGFGEGESNTWGFVYCLSASNGRVEWLFCTTKFNNPDTSGSENQPNDVPPALAPSSLGAYSGMSKASNNPAHYGSSPWSHASYDGALNRIFIGTGNSRSDGTLPEPRYSNGILSLNATNGDFEGFYQPPRASNYRPTALENDIDVPAGPTLFTRGGQRYLGFGSKNGSFFVLNPSTMAEVTRKQMLPYTSGGAPFANVDPGAGENRSGVMATAAVNYSEQKLFVPVGGYAGTGSIDHVTTPFMRAINWQTLSDAWPTSGSNPPKYTNVGATMYTNAGESGMASPATTNDVVFMSTTSSGLYAYRASDGLHLRTLVAAGGTNVAGSMGPAIYGAYVVAGFYSGHLRIFKLQP